MNSVPTKRQRTANVASAALVFSTDKPMVQLKKKTSHNPAKKKARFELYITWIDGVHFVQVAERTGANSKARYHFNDPADQLKFLCRRIENMAHRMKLAKLYDNAEPIDSENHLLIEVFEGRINYENEVFKRLQSQGIKVDQSRIKQYEGQ